MGKIPKKTIYGSIFIIIGILLFFIGFALFSFAMVVGVAMLEGPRIAFCIGTALIVAGPLIIIAGIIIFKGKKQDTPQQSTGEDNL